MIFLSFAKVHAHLYYAESKQSRRQQGASKLVIDEDPKGREADKGESQAHPRGGIMGARGTRDSWALRFTPRHDERKSIT